MKKLFLLLLIIVSSSLIQSQGKYLLIRCDDFGMSHSVNMALVKLIETRIPFSASVMFACPWYQETAEILKRHPEISVGVHLTLNSEWKNYRWGPVSGREAVPSLVDSNGYFFPSRDLFNANDPDLDEIEKELRAQVQRAFDSGISIDYLDYHMGTAVDKPEYRAIVEELAKDFNLGISRYFGEYYMNNMYNKPYEHKADSLYKVIMEMQDGINLLVCHIGIDNNELSALIDMNSFGLKEMSKHRQAELNALTSERFRGLLEEENIKLVTYRDLILEKSLDNMQRPEE